MMTRGRGGVWLPPENDDVIYEQPLSYTCSQQMSPVIAFDIVVTTVVAQKVKVQY